MVKHIKNKRCYDVSLSIGAGNNSGGMDLYHKLMPGDILLTQTSGFVYSLWRKLSCTMYDHSAVVLENNDTINVVYPITKKLPVSHFFRFDRTPFVLRPVWRSEKQTLDFIHSMKQLEGTPYNSLRGIFNITNMVIYHRLGLKIPLKVPQITSRKWVCTDVILIYLKNVVPEFEKISELDLDIFRFGFTSPNDFIKIAYYMPDLLKKIE
ncbi:MAG: hypothetical protein M1381_05230 [Deltaproteobacteria bacterium]|nr:hypothetical protein [Deltaproteobacteria bacterium]MCL5791535.1 hypothetical protein [Deltaproteobacteria bacterium]